MLVCYSMPMAEPTFIHPKQLWHDLGLRADQTVVHLGCGAGFYIIPAAHIVGRHGKVVGIDVLATMLEEVEGRARRAGLADVVHTVRANLEESRGSTLADTSADWVLVANILHQSDPPKILAEAKRLLRPAGKVVVIEWAVAATPLGPPSTKRVAEHVVRDVAEQVGLHIERSFKPSPYHYGLVLSELAS